MACKGKKIASLCFLVTQLIIQIKWQKLKLTIKLQIHLPTWTITRWINQCWVFSSNIKLQMRSKLSGKFRRSLWFGGGGLWGAGGGGGRVWVQTLLFLFFAFIVIIINTPTPNHHHHQAPWHKKARWRQAYTTGTKIASELCVNGDLQDLVHQLSDQ